MGPTIEEVNLHLAAGSKDLRFPPTIEAAFEGQRRAYRAKALRRIILPSLICYNGFLPLDCLLLPSTAEITVALHAVVSGWIMVAALVFRTGPALMIREVIGVSIPILMVAQLIAICRLNEAVSAVMNYNFLIIMILIYMNINQRPDFRFAFGASLLIAVAYVLLLFTGHFENSTRAVGAGSMIAAVYLSLNATWRMERDARYAFVMRLRDRLRCEAAEREADRDALTGLFNRRFLAQRADELWSDTKPATSAAIIMLDVDHFKDFNDRYGHPAGDICLKRVATATQAVMPRPDDVVARYGGEEFIVLLPHTDLVAALKVADRIRNAVESAAIPHEGIGASGRITVSLGVASALASELSLPDLIAGADAALYAAKRNGRNRIWPQPAGSGPNLTVLSIAGRAARA